MKPNLIIKDRLFSSLKIITDYNNFYWSNLVIFFFLLFVSVTIYIRNKSIIDKNEKKEMLNKFIYQIKNFK